MRKVALSGRREVEVYESPAGSSEFEYSVENLGGYSNHIYSGREF